MSKRRKKEAIAKIVVVAVLAVCLILLAIFGIWLIGQLTDDEPGGKDDVLGSGGAISGVPDGFSTDTDEGIVALVEAYLYQMQSSDFITLYYDDFSVEISAADAKASYDVEKLKEYLSANDLDPAFVDTYVARGNSPQERTPAEDYILQSVYSLNDVINKTNVQGYSVDGRTVTVYKSSEVINVDVEKTCSAVKSRLASRSFGPLEAVVSINESGEPNWQEIRDRVYVEPKDAEYVYNAETKTTDLVGETVGYSLDIEKMRRDYQNSNENVLVFEADEILPEITAANIQEKMFPDLLSSYTSWYNSNETNRTNNLKLAAAAINGTVVMPETQFSFNGVVGERTEEAGYMEATIYTKDGMTDGLGGGICQVSSTLYCAALFADFDIVERWNHSYTVSYVDLGRDATVSYGWLDFRFANNYDNPILITTSAVNGMLTIEIHGTKVDNISVSLRHEQVEKLEPEIKIERDDTLGSEEYKLESKGKAGYIIKTYKSVTINGEYLGEELIHTDTYDPLNGLAKVGPNWTESSDGPEETTADTEESTSATEASSSETPAPDATDTTADTSSEDEPSATDAPPEPPSET